MRIKPGGFRRGIEFQQEYIRHLGEGLIATDGVVYGAAATFGTTPVVIINELIDPGFSMLLKELQVGLTQEFSGNNGSLVGSISYFWEAQEAYTEPGGATGPTLVTGAFINVTGTIQKGVGTLTTSEDTFSGYIPVGSLSHAPVRIKLTATGIGNHSASGRVKNSSFIKLVGNVLPGS